MVKGKRLIERIWWLIPPLFFLFVYMPLRAYFTLRHYPHFNSWGVVDKLVSDWPSYLYSWITNPIEIILPVFVFGFMAIGCYITRRKSLPLRIIVPIILSFIGEYMAFLMLLAIYGA